MKEPGYKTALQRFILEAYHELKGTENLVDKWAIYHRALRKVKLYFIHTLKLDIETKDLCQRENEGNDVY